jgi:hypothetical protein
MQLVEIKEFAASRRVVDGVDGEEYWNLTSPPVVAIMNPSRIADINFGLIDKNNNNNEQRNIYQSIEYTSYIQATSRSTTRLETRALDLTIYQKQEAVERLPDSLTEQSCNKILQHSSLLAQFQK